MSEKTMRACRIIPLATPLPGAYPDATGKTIDRYYPEKVLSGEVGPQDVRISLPDPLSTRRRLPNRCSAIAVARNFRRAAELYRHS